MSGAVLSADLLDQLGRSGEVPLFVRLLALAAARANSEGEAWFEVEELCRLLQHPSESHPRAPLSVLKAINKAQGFGLLADGSTATCLRVPRHQVRTMRTAVI